MTDARTIFAALALAGQAAAPTAPPVAPTPPAASPAELDARCLDAFLYSGGAAGPDRLGVLFFYGRLTGRDPALDLPAAMRAAAPAIATNVAAETERCRAELRAAGGALGAAGGALKGR